MLDLISPKGKVIIEKEEDISVTGSGIILRETDREKSYKGTIMSVSDDSEFKVGQIIYYDHVVNQVFNYNEKNYYIIQEQNILCVIE